MTATIDLAPPAEAAAHEAGHRLAVDQLGRIHLPRDCDQLELIDGEVYVNPAPRLSHNDIVRELVHRVDGWVRRNRLGHCYFAPTDVWLSPSDLVQPDFLFVPADRAAAMSDLRVDALPDLVVEVLSPSTRERDLGAKRDLYERAGVREYWIVDPEASAVTLLALEGRRYVEVPPVKGRLDSRVLPGLRLNPKLLFRGALPNG